MKHSHAYIIIGVLAMLLFASCGQRYQAKGLVKDFVKAHAVAPDEIDITSFSDLDSTKVISDSLLQVLQTNAAKDPLFKDVSFTTQRTSHTLLFIRMRYGADSLNQSRTFYFDKDLTGIIAFK